MNEPYENGTYEADRDLRDELALCERETEVIEAMDQGSLSEELDRHIASCPACADTHRVARLFALEGERALEEADRVLASGQRLPSADEIWRRARTEERRAAVERALWPIRVVERLSTVVAALVVVVGGGWLGSALKPWVAPLMAPFSHSAEQVSAAVSGAVSSTVAGASSFAPSPGTGVALLLALALGGLALGMYSSWSRQT